MTAALRSAAVIASLALALAPAASADTPLAVFSASWQRGGPAPLVVTDSSLAGAIDTNGRPIVRVCVSFRNVTAQPITSTIVDATFRDGAGGPVVFDGNAAALTQRFGGKFAPGALVEHECFARTMPEPDQVRRMRTETVSIRSVTFADGSAWQSGAPFTRAYADDGSVPSPAPAVTPTPQRTARPYLLSRPTPSP
ncbi:MAG TPA: hypothetical protein VMD91_10815 [Candidatus Sulfotelmatobacter sp.]|nr:hypothetical protein [Candidatus Sulfotelmatobacter sp.]